MTISTACPPVTWIRRSIEQHILDLYEADGTTLRPEVNWPGTYSLPSGSRIPAVFVVGPDMVPKDWVITGIETTLDAVPESDDKPSYGGVVSIESWAVRFTNYGTDKSATPTATLLDIRRRLTRVFPGDRVTYMAPTEATFEAITVRLRGAVLFPPIP
jgi:hypothetical protein